MYVGYMTIAKIKRIVKEGNDVAYVVMENQFKNLKGKIGVLRSHSE